jgi:hypothetical protein
MKATKKISMMLALFISFNFSFSQPRLGYKLNEVYDEFSPTEYPISDLGKNHGIGYHFYVQLPIGNVAYYSDVDSVILLTVVVPKDEKMWNLLLKEYNTNATKIDGKSWIYCFDEIKTANLVEIINDKNDTFHKLKGDYIKISYTNY